MNAEAAQHFINLARRGAHPASSGGEKIAHALAKALHKIGDDVCLLDADAIEGACTMLRLMSGPFRTWEDKERIYKAIAQAAGKKK